MDIDTGEVLSLVSLPDYDLNVRQEIKHENFMNKITKGVFELGSIFKTFTITLALENKLFSPDTVIKDIPNEIKCSKYTITEHDELPSSLTLRDILIRSSNIGTIKIAKQIGKNKLKKFLEDLLEYYINESESYKQFAEEYDEFTNSKTDVTFGLIVGTLYSAFLQTYSNQQLQVELDDIREFHEIIKTNSDRMVKSLEKKDIN